ncbi:MAG: hypothetical protein QOE48_6405 [Mycobacterium sp.]|nr:hypothetical protein [Mycobacterium sp.]
MAAPASPLKQAHRTVQLPGAAAPRPAPEVLRRYHFQVVAANVTDAVMSIGGLIFDRAMAGWDVSVVVDAETARGIDDRPIRILGGKVTSLVGGPNRAEMLPRPHMLAVATDVMVKSEAVVDGERARVHVADRVDQAHHPPERNCRFVPVRHRPSAAAQAFKSHAPAAGGAIAVHQADEGFYSMA